MPQERTRLYSGPGLLVEKVLHAAASPADSILAVRPTYEVASTRYVTSTDSAAEFWVGDQCTLLDPITALCLPAGLRYQTVPLGLETRISWVVSARSPGVHTLPPAGAWLLTPFAVWQSHLHWSHLHWQSLSRISTCSPNPDLTTQQLLRGALTCATPTAAAWALRPLRPASPVVRRARRYLATAELASPCRLRDVAQAAHCNPFHLAHAFTQQTGISVYAYRQRLRLAHAIARLHHPNTSLAQLADELGYSSQSHMGSVFKQALGITPAHARAKLAHA